MGGKIALAWIVLSCERLVIWRGSTHSLLDLLMQIAHIS